LQTWSKVCRYWGKTIEDRARRSKCRGASGTIGKASGGSMPPKKVQILRFVELCEQYGYREGNTREMAPIGEWEADDREELVELLEIAAVSKPTSHRVC